MLARAMLDNMARLYLLLLLLPAEFPCCTAYAELNGRPVAATRSSRSGRWHEQFCRERAQDFPCQIRLSSNFFTRRLGSWVWSISRVHTAGGPRCRRKRAMGSWRIPTVQCSMPTRALMCKASHTLFELRLVVLEQESVTASMVADGLHNSGLLGCSRVSLLRQPPHSIAREEGNLLTY